MSLARRVLAAAALGVVTLSACSNTEAPVNREPHTGSATASEVSGVQTITLDVGDDYRFHPSTFSVHPGLVTVILKHTGTAAPHNFSAEGHNGVQLPGAYVPLVSGGQTKSATFHTPSPGKYEFVCTIHVKQGQTGSMIVLDK